MILPSEIQIRFVGATIGRPLHLPEFYADNQHFFRTENKYRIHCLTIIRRATNGRPYTNNSLNWHENKEFSVYSVGANCVRPLGLQLALQKNAEAKPLHFYFLISKVLCKAELYLLYQLNYYHSYPHF